MKHNNTPQNLQLFLATQDQLRSVVSECVKEALQISASTTQSASASSEIIDTKELISRLGLSEPTIIRYRQK